MSDITSSMNSLSGMDRIANRGFDTSGFAKSKAAAAVNATPDPPAPVAASKSSSTGSMIPDVNKTSILQLYKNIYSHFAPETQGLPGIPGLLGSLQSGIYDSTKDIQELRRQSANIGELPTEAQTAADSANLQASGAQYLLDRMKGVDVPQQGMLAQPELPTLDLPGAPEVAKAQVSPLSSLLALGAGFAAPQAAGQFHAAALEGALEGAKQENARRQQANKEEITRRSMVYDAAMTSAREREHVVEINRDAAFNNSVLKTDRQLSMAKAETDSFMAKGTADAAKDYVNKYSASIKAKSAVDALYKTIDLENKLSKEHTLGVSELLKAVDKAGDSSRLMTKEVFDSYMKDSLQQSNNAATANRQAAHDEAMNNREQNKDVNTYNRGLMLKKLDIQGKMALMSESERFKFRMAEWHRHAAKEEKPSQSLDQSQKNQARLQKDLSAIETQITDLRATPGRNTDKDYRLNELVHIQQQFSDSLAEEQRRAQFLDPTRADKTMNWDFRP
jgi:hypothetical protein